MKLVPRSLIIAAALAAAASLPAQQPEPQPAPKPPKSEPKKEIHMRRLDRPAEMETVTFLGVETAPVSPTLIAQLALPMKAGLVVMHVVPNSAAAGALQPHDILLKLDDQILVDQHQLSVLIRNHKEGDEVTLTYVRGGKQATARVKLTKHEVPKINDVLHRIPMPLGAGRVGAIGIPQGNREEVDRVLSLVERAHAGEPIRMRIENGGPGMRAVSVNTNNSNLVYSDDKGSLELVSKGGEKLLVVKGPTGEQQFSGPVSTPEQREALSQDVRERLEKLESMQNVTFRTDGDFQGAQTRVFDSSGEQISLRRIDTPRPNAARQVF